MPMDVTQPLLARRNDHLISIAGGVDFEIRDCGNGWLDLSAPDFADLALARRAALAAFEAVTNHGEERAIQLAGAGWAPLLADFLASGVAILIDGQPSVLPALFWQVPERWLLQPAPVYPTIMRAGPHGRHPQRPPKPQGLLYRRHIPWLDQWFTLRAAALDDLPIFHRWQNDPRVAAFFEEAGSLEQHREYLSRLLSDPHMMPVIGSVDGRDFAYFELYWTRENRLGAHYDAAAWDRGWHVLIGEEDTRGADYVTAWLPSLMHYLFLAEPRTEAVMGEPKASHLQQLKNLMRSGFAHVRDFDFAHKRAALVRLERQHFFEARMAYHCLCHPLAF
jgi:acetyl CoA:N6-hydroxylysine acetyl transferase